MTVQAPVVPYPEPAERGKILRLGLRPDPDDCQTCGMGGADAGQRIPQRQRPYPG